jgi:YfiH family protein
MITSSRLAEGGRVRHGFFTRLGGVSAGVYASLNCGFGSGDDLAAVAINRERVVAQLDGDAVLVTVRQAHTADAVVVEKPWPSDQAPVADALVTRTPGIALGVLTADCAPILLADHDAGVIGAVHAGWRGALTGVIEAAVRAIIELGGTPERLAAAVGPCIRQPSYEVGPDMRKAFLDIDAGYDRFFRPAAAGDRLFFDLAAFAGARLAGCGVNVVDVLDHDTCADERLFFSYRRNQKAGEPRYGRGISAICLAGR